MIALTLLVLIAVDPWQNLIARHSFDWRSPSGKTPVAGAWTIHKGMLTVKPYVHRRTDLWSTGEYGDFELEWQWKAAKGANSGVKYWVQSASTLVIVKEDHEWRTVADPAVAKAEEPTLEYSRADSNTRWPMTSLSRCRSSAAIRAPVDSTACLRQRLRP